MPSGSRSPTTATRASPTTHRISRSRSPTQATSSWSSSSSAAAPSLYWDFIDAGHEGAQHWSSWPVNYHEIREKALASGWHVGQEGDSPRGPFIYFLEEGHPGTIIEMAEATPTRMRIFDQVRDAAKNWDGSDPIRESWPQG
jgi:hypothetical protein